MNYPDSPRTEAQKILVESGKYLGTKIYGSNGRPGDVYESRVVNEIPVGNNHVVLVYEYGTIDTDHTLYLVNVAERVCARIDSALYSTPGGYFGGIEITSAEEQSDGILIKWTARHVAKEGKYTLKTETRVKEEVVAVLKKAQKFLFIEDDAEFLRSLKLAFNGKSNVVFAECHSVEDGLKAIAEEKPDVIFLDHHLSEGGNEGLEIAGRVSGVKIYTTTSNTNVLPAYRAMGIEAIGKTNLKKYREVIG